VDSFDITRLKLCGSDVFISPAAEIRRPHLVEIGSHVAIDTGFYCTVGALIGDYVHIGPYVTVIGGAEGRFEIGHFATVSAGTRIICASDAFAGEGFTSVTVPAAYRDRVVRAPVRIGRFAGVATNVVIVPGVTLGEGSVVGACSLVTRDTEPWTVYYGTPARAAPRHGARARLLEASCPPLRSTWPRRPAVSLGEWRFWAGRGSRVETSGIS
jgi:acetyltransferase-like isoleucine patch superfamily enzyme